jgi:hypothetical protein
MCARQDKWSAVTAAPWFGRNSACVCLEIVYIDHGKLDSGSEKVSIEKQAVTITKVFLSLGRISSINIWRVPPGRLQTQEREIGKDMRQSKRSPYVQKNISLANGPERTLE